MTKSVDGYGICVLNGRRIGAHRASLWLKLGHNDSPVCCHTCDNKWCVNPDHLFPGDPRLNNQDKIKWECELTLDDMKEIRESSLPTVALARYWKLSNKIIGSIRPMKKYKENRARDDKKVHWSNR